MDDSSIYSLGTDGYSLLRIVGSSATEVTRWARHKAALTLENGYLCGVAGGVFWANMHLREEAPGGSCSAPRVLPSQPRYLERSEGSNEKVEHSFGFVKQASGYGYEGATEHDVALMRRYSSIHLTVKPSGDVRTLEQMLRLVQIGATRIGTAATASIHGEAVRHFGR